MQKTSEDTQRTAVTEAPVEAIVEAVLFLYGDLVPFARVAQVAHVTESAARAIVERVQTAYAQRDGGLRIIVTDRGAQMVTHPAVAATIETFTKKELEGPLTPVATEVLAIIAYRGPIGKTDIEAIRGVNCSFTLRNLMRRGLIERVPQTETQSRSHQYRVTTDFLRVLGIARMEELPAFAEIAQDARIDAIVTHDRDATSSHDAQATQ